MSNEVKESAELAKASKEVEEKRKAVEKLESELKNEIRRGYDTEFTSKKLESASKELEKAERSLSYLT